MWFLHSRQGLCRTIIPNVIKTISIQKIRSGRIFIANFVCWDSSPSVSYTSVFPFGLDMDDTLESVGPNITVKARMMKASIYILISCITLQINPKNEAPNDTRRDELNSI